MERGRGRAFLAQRNPFARQGPDRDARHRAGQGAFRAAGRAVLAAGRRPRHARWFRWLLFSVVTWAWVMPGPVVGIGLHEIILMLPDGPWETGALLRPIAVAFDVGAGDPGVADCGCLSLADRAFDPAGVV